MTDLKNKALTYWETCKATSSTTLAMVPLRLYLGLFYYYTGSNKVMRGDFGLKWTDSMVRQVEAAIPETYTWYAYFLENVVLVYPKTFTILVAWGELLLSIALLFGVSTRLAALLGAFMAFNFSLMSGREFWLPSFDTTLSVALLALGLSCAGRVFGLDQYFSKRWPNKFLW